MRKKLNYSIVICLLLLPFYTFSQVTQKEINQEKYWRFRERLKNFIVFDDCQGCGLIAKFRDEFDPSNSPAAYESLLYNSNTVLKSGNGNLSYPDEVMHLGLLMGALASEYSLLRLSGETLKASQTLKELAYVLEAFNRLDKTAEPWWRYYFNGAPAGTGHPSGPDLNGFFIRNDVPINFPNMLVGGDLIENRLNSGYFHVDDGKIVETIQSTFTDDVLREGQNFPNLSFAPLQNCHHFENDRLGPIEESLDQVCNIMLGLALCAKNIPPFQHAQDNNGNTFHFSDGQTDVLLEVKAIAERITFWIQSHGWNIINPITNSCVKGVFWDENITSTDPCKCIAGGAVFELFAYGLAMVNTRIQIAPDMTNDVLASNFYAIHYASDATVTTSASAWLTTLNNVSIGKEDYKVLTLAAAGHVWGASTGLHLVARCAHEFTSDQMPGDRWHLPLVHQAIYGALNTSYPAQFYECLINNAPCKSTHNNDENFYWSSQGGLAFDGTIGSGPYYDLETPNYSYLLYFNLFNLVYPHYLLLGSNYHSISPFNLCDEDILKQNYFETDKKTFIASNTITARAEFPTNPIPEQKGKYVIENDNDLQPFPYSRADINFLAKKEIILQPGFEVHAGSNFSASIVPYLNGMNCNSSTSVAEGTCESWIAAFRTQSNSSSYQEVYDSYFVNHRSDQIDSSKYSIDKQQKEHFISIYPNPSNGFFIIDFSDKYSELEVDIFDIFGKQLKIEKLIKPKSEINLSDFSKGMYLVKIVDVNRNEVVNLTKIIIQ